MRAERLMEVGRRFLEVVTRDVDLLLPVREVLREGFGVLPLPLPRPLCISWRGDLDVFSRGYFPNRQSMLSSRCYAGRKK